ncbi:MAG TPA: hypothetical protein VN805_03685 [Caulobacteraceae bacterium]|nr:hypothetical protein [Caulobacteraceae bacterium]
MPLRLVAAIALSVTLVGGAAVARTSFGRMPRHNLIHLSRPHAGRHVGRHTGHRSSGRRMHGY